MFIDYVITQPCENDNTVGRKIIRVVKVYNIFNIYKPIRKVDVNPKQSKIKSHVMSWGWADFIRGNTTAKVGH